MSGLYFECLIYRKEAMQHMGSWKGCQSMQSDLPIGRRGCTVSVYAVDQMEGRMGRCTGIFSTVYLLKNRE